MPRAKRQRAGTKTKAKKSTGVASMASLIEYDPNDPISIGIFGAAATGKTTLWSTFPKPTLALFCSGGLKNPGELKSLTKAEKADVTPLRIESTEQLSQILESLTNDLEGFQTVVIDHLTALSDLIIAEMLGVDRAKPQREWGDMTMQQWGQFGQQIKILLRDFIELPANSVIVSQERLFEPPEGSEIGVTKVGPAVTPSVAGWLTATLDYSIQTFVRAKTKTKTVTIRGKEKTKEVKTDELEFCAYLPLCEDRMTKFRKPRGTKLDPVMVDPSYDKIIALTEGE